MLGVNANLNVTKVIMRNMTTGLVLANVFQEHLIILANAHVVINLIQ